MPRPAYLRSRETLADRVTPYALMLVALVLAWYPLSIWLGLAGTRWLGGPAESPDSNLWDSYKWLSLAILVAGSLLLFGRTKRTLALVLPALVISWGGMVLLFATNAGGLTTWFGD